MESKGCKSESKGKTKVQGASQERERANMSKNIQDKTDLGTASDGGKGKRKMTDFEEGPGLSRRLRPLRHTSESESFDEQIAGPSTSALEDAKFTSSDTSEDEGIPQLTLTSTSDNNRDIEPKPGCSRDYDAWELNRPRESPFDSAHSSRMIEDLFGMGHCDSSVRPPSSDSEDDTDDPDDSDLSLGCSPPSFIKPLLAENKVEEILLESFRLKHSQFSLTTPDTEDHVGAVMNPESWYGGQSGGTSPVNGERRLSTSSSSTPVDDDASDLFLELTDTEDEKPKHRCLDCYRQSKIDPNYREPDWHMICDSSEPLQRPTPQPEAPAPALEVLDFPPEPPPNTQRPKSPFRWSVPRAESPAPPKVKTTPRWKCPICYDKSVGQEVVATQCGHVFCRACLASYLFKFSNRCPACRADLTMKAPISLFNI